MANPKVLVVEDDPQLLMIAVEAFRETGLLVVEVATADAAIGVLESIGDQVAVVFSDI